MGNLLINKKISNLIKPNWNFGPNISNCKTVLQVVKKIILIWGVQKKINIIEKHKFKESKLLMLSNQKAKRELNWRPRLTFEETIQMTVNWYKHFFSYGTMERLSREQIDFFTNK